MKKAPHNVSAFVNREAERILKANGFEFAPYPKNGPVMYEGVQVGYMDNFNGFMVREHSITLIFEKGLLGAPGFGWWNYREALDQWFKDGKPRWDKTKAE